MDKVTLMKQLINLYEQIDSMPDVETKLVIEEFIAKKERELGEILNG